MKLKSTQKILLSMAVLGGALAPISANAEVIPSNQSTEVTGTFQTSTIDVSIPASNSFIFNPDTGTASVSDITIQNKTNAPVYITSDTIQVSDLSVWKPTLVNPTAFPGWDLLTTVQTENNVALGLKSIVSTNWLSGIQGDTFWSTDLTTPKKMGVIKAKTDVSIQPAVQAGTAFNTEKILTSNYIFTVGLE